MAGSTYEKHSLELIGVEMSDSKKYCSITFDVDAWWTVLEYKKLYPPKDNDIIILKGIPRILKLLDTYNVKSTFFCLGADIERNTSLYREIVERGHEIASHSYSHNHSFKYLKKDQMVEEIKKTHNIIEDKLGVSSVGFRAPNYSFNESVLSCLKRLNYQYESSVLPTFLPGITPAKWIMAPHEPYTLDDKDITKKGSSGILELPLAVSSFFRIPISGTFTRLLGLRWLRFSTFFHNRRYMNINIHPVDLVPEKPFLKGLPINFYWRNDVSQTITEHLIKHLAGKRTTITCANYCQMIKNDMGD